MRRLLAALVAIFIQTAGCGDGDARPVQLQLIGRGSCQSYYNLSCMASLRVQMFDDTRDFRSQCTELSPPFVTFGDLVSSRETLFVLKEVRARKNVRIEVRGYHNRGDENTPCENLADDRLMMWGTSDIVDFTASDISQINVFVDCRPGCDCHFMEQTCPLELERGVCAPRVATTCRGRECTRGCFDELLRCEAGVCQPDEGGVCSDCTESKDCVSELCVRHTYQNQSLIIDENFCADDALCPPLVGHAFSCPEGMACARLGDGNFEKLL